MSDTALTRINMDTEVTSARWTAEQAWNWHHLQPWRCGFNYVPSSAVNSIEMWQHETFDLPTMERELGWAQELGFNTCRIYLPFVLWRHEPQALLERVELFLEIADERGHKSMVVLFDDCDSVGHDPFLGFQGEPVPGRHNSRWTPSPGHRHATNRELWPDFEAYVSSVVGHFAQDERILMWDLYNEPGQSGMGEKSLPLLRDTFAWARAALPHQPLTSGLHTGPPPNLGEIAGAVPVEGAQRLTDFMLSESDIISFHDYGDLARLHRHVCELKTLGRPLICTEWLCRTHGSHIKTHLDVFKAEKIGCYFWGLVNGRTQTQFPWGSPENAPDPDVWFHDLLRTDGTPYDEKEVALIQQALASQQETQA